MADDPQALSRRRALQLIGASAAAAGLAVGRGVAQAADATAQSASAAQTAGATPMPPFTGPEANPHWDAVGPYVAYPQKLPLILLTDRPVQLETPRAYFATAITPTAAFYVRWHLDGHPEAVNLVRWRLGVEGAVAKPLSLSLDELMKFPEVTVAAVNQCSGNSRSRVQPRVPGSQWGNGGMGCAHWTGVRLRDVLAAAGAKKNAVQVQFEGTERGKGPPEKGAYKFLKSVDLSNPVIDDIILAYAMNGEPLPLLNGFPLRVVMPGYFATYWVKALGTIRVLDAPDDNYWMKTAYRIPDTPRGNITPEEAKAGHYTKVPIGRMPVRSFLVTPDGSSKLPAGMAVTLQGIAFSGYGAIKQVEVSTDGGATWAQAKLGEALGTYAFRTWTFPWKPTTRGAVTVSVRATDTAGNVQTDLPLWNSGGYGWNRIETQQFTVGPGA